jgi:hypothetical protein
MSKRAKLPLIAVLCAVGALTQHAAHGQQASVSAWDAADFRSWSFIPNWTSQTHVNTFRTDRVYDHVSDVLYSFGVQPRADGSLYYRPEATNHLARLKSDQEMFGFRYHMCMFTVNGGSTDAVWESIVNTPSIRTTFINNVEGLLTANNMTGFNLDWERPNTVSEWGNYTQLAREMQAAFPAEWEVSVDDYGIPHGYPDSTWDDSPLFDPDVFDQVGIMAYHYAASSQATWLNRHKELGFSDSQLILGMGTWGQGGPATLPLKNLVAADPNLAANATNWSGTAIDVNGNTQTGTWDIVSRYEVRDNVQLALNRGLAGIMWWTLSYDATNKLSLQRVAQHYAMVKRNIPDLNLDGKVNAADAMALADNMGSVPGWTGTNTPARFEDFYMSGNWEQGDRDGNGFVNQQDADWLANRFTALGVNIPDRLAYTGTFENFQNSRGLTGRWRAKRETAGNLRDTGNYTQHGASGLSWSGAGVGAAMRSNNSLTIRNQNASEQYDGLNTLPRILSVDLATPINTATTDETYITFLVRENTASLLSAHLASNNRTLSLDFLNSAGVNQFDFAFRGKQHQFSIESQADASGQDVTSGGFASDATYLFVGKITGNGTGANTMQASLFGTGSTVGNFASPDFPWAITAQGSAGFNPLITQLQFTSLYQASYTVSNVWVGTAADFFALPSATAGDFNMDGNIDVSDYLVWRKSMGQLGHQLAADANGNGIIDNGDYDTWNANFGSVAGGGSDAPVPEPQSAALILFAVAWLSSRSAHSLVFRRNY